MALSYWGKLLQREAAEISSIGLSLGLSALIHS